MNEDDEDDRPKSDNNVAHWTTNNLRWLRHVVYGDVAA